MGNHFLILSIKLNNHQSSLKLPFMYFSLHFSTNSTSWLKVSLSSCFSTFDSRGFESRWNFFRARATFLLKPTRKSWSSCFMMTISACCALCWLSKTTCLALQRSFLRALPSSSWIFAQVVRCTYIVTEKLSYLSVISNTRPRLDNYHLVRALWVIKFQQPLFTNYSVSSSFIVLKSSGVLGRWQLAR